MSSRIIPKEDLTAYQRWELGVFDGRENAEQQQEPVEEVRLPTAEDIERIHQEAWQEGHQEGYQLGLAEGRRVGEDFSQRAQALFAALAEERLQQDHELAEEVLQLSLAIARQVVGASFEVKPELMLKTLQEALTHLPTLSGHPKLIVHPNDAAIVKDWLVHEHGHLNWRVSEDDTMHPGGFRIESTQGELDSSLQTRWQEIVAALGANPEWLK